MRMHQIIIIKSLLSPILFVPCLLVWMTIEDNVIASKIVDFKWTKRNKARVKRASCKYFTIVAGWFYGVLFSNGLDYVMHCKQHSLLLAEPVLVFGGHQCKCCQWMTVFRGHTGKRGPQQPLVNLTGYISSVLQQDCSPASWLLYR